MAEDYLAPGYTYSVARILETLPTPLAKCYQVIWLGHRFVSGSGQCFWSHIGRAKEAIVKTLLHRSLLDPQQMPPRRLRRSDIRELMNAHEAAGLLLYIELNP